MRNSQIVVNGPGGSIDTLPTRNVYPTAGGPSLGMQVDGMSPFSHTGRRYDNMSMNTGGGVAAEVDGEEEAASGGILGQPAGWFITLFALLLGLMYGARKLGAESDYSNLKLSTYNIIVISLAAIIGIAFFKVLFARFKVPGLSTFIAAV